MGSHQTDRALTADDAPASSPARLSARRLRIGSFFCGTQAVDGKSIMQLMMLAATQGTELEITAEGADAEQAIATLEKLVKDKFGEE